MITDIIIISFIAVLDVFANLKLDPERQFKKIIEPNVVEVVFL